MTQSDTSDSVRDVRQDPLYKVLRSMARWALAAAILNELAKRAARRE